MCRGENENRVCVWREGEIKRWRILCCYRLTWSAGVLHFEVSEDNHRENKRYRCPPLTRLFYFILFSFVLIIFSYQDVFCLLQATLRRVKHAVCTRTHNVMTSHAQNLVESRCSLWCACTCNARNRVCCVSCTPGGARHLATSCLQVSCKFDR